MALGGKLDPIAVFSSCCTTGLIESLCSAWGELGAGAFEMLNCSWLRDVLRWLRKELASFSVHKYRSMVCSLYRYFCWFVWS